jgi:hypothetical protein
MSGESCPTCGTIRVGSFRYCLSCQFDFEMDVARPAVAARSAALQPTMEPGRVSIGWLFLIAVLTAAGCVWFWANTAAANQLAHVLYTALIGVVWTWIVVSVAQASPLWRHHR